MRTLKQRSSGAKCIELYFKSGIFGGVTPNSSGKNKNYSLRKFAKDLNFSPSTLCEFFKGKKNLSEIATLQIISKLKFDKKEADYFYKLTSFERCKNPEVKGLLQKQIQQNLLHRKLYELSTDTFQLMSDWHYSAIVAACDLDFKVDLKILSRLFRLSSIDVQLSVDRLMRLGLVEKLADGTLQACRTDVQVQTTAPNQALQNFTKQILLKAMDSQLEQGNDERVFGTETLAIDANDLPKLRELTNEYFENVIKIAKKGKNKKSVYSLGVQLFRLSRKVK